MRGCAPCFAPLAARQFCSASGWRSFRLPRRKSSPVMRGSSSTCPRVSPPGRVTARREFSYFSPDGEIEFDILIQKPGQYPAAEEMAEKMLQKLGSQGQSTSFVYEGRGAVIAELSFTLGTTPRRGYALFIQEASGSGYALLAHAGASRFDAAADFILSCLDAFSIDRAARRSPGPVSQFLLPWPAPRPDRKTAALPGGRIELPWSPEEAQQELFTVQREYRILTTYLADSTHWQDAWARFYRMAYRESAGRLDGFTEAFVRTLPACGSHGERPQGPRPGCRASSSNAISRASISSRRWLPLSSAGAIAIPGPWSWR